LEKEFELTELESEKQIKS